MNNEMFINMTKAKRNQLAPIWYSSGIIAHISLKITITLWHELQLMTAAVYQDILFLQIFFLLLFTDFWFTKNVAGRMLLGLRWYYGQDKYNIERLMFQSRINQTCISFQSSMWFWIIQIAYTIFPLYHLRQIFNIQSGLSQVSTQKVIIKTIQLAILVIVFFSGYINISYFFIGWKVCKQRREKFRVKYGDEIIYKMGKASFHCYK